MKTSLKLIWVITASLLALEELPGQRARPLPPMSSPTKELMRQKLAGSQAVLEGITTEDFPLVAREARKLRALSQSADWPAIENSEYTQYVTMFRSNVGALAKAADDRNLDGATLAYFKMTLSCVECHKFVRGKKMAGLSNTDTLVQVSLQKSLQKKPNNPVDK